MSAELLRAAAAKMPKTFLAKVSAEGECWLWCGGRSSAGYGRFWIDGHFVQAHRFSFELLVGDIPEALVLDHLCRTRDCVRPDHLEPVTSRENAQRGLKGRMVQTCAQGHSYTSANTYFKPNGCRNCRECRRNRNRAYRARAYLGSDQ